MKTKTVASRRVFLSQAGVALSAPLAAGAAAASAREDPDRRDLLSRLTELEAVNAIRGLNRLYARYVNAREFEEARSLFDDPGMAVIGDDVCGLSPDPLAEPDLIEIDADRGTAKARVHCTVVLATPIEPGSTLAQMARAQGEGFVRATESRVIEVAYVERGGVWKIVAMAFRPASES